MDEALKNNQLALAMGDAKMANKAKSLNRKIEQAQKLNKPLILNGDDTFKDVKDFSHEAHNKIEATIGYLPGDLCCFLLYRDPQAATEEVKQMTATVPHFKSREGIERKEADTKR